MKLLFTLALPVFLLQNAQAQTMSRLVGKADWYNNLTMFVPQDTTSYVYMNAARGGDLTHQMKFDNSEMWTATDTSIIPSSYVAQTFNGDNTISTITTETYSAFSGSFAPVTKVNYFYTGGVLSTMINQNNPTGTWTNVSEDVYGYDGSGNLSTDRFGMWRGYYFDTTSQVSYFYSGSNLIQKTNQNYTGGTWVNVSQYNYQYVAGTNWVSSYTYSTWTGAGYSPVYTYTNTYDSTGDRLTQTYQTYAMGSPVNVTLKTYSGFNSAMEPTSELDQTWDTAGGGSYMNSRNWTYTYNSYNQLTQSVGESWNIAGFWEYAAGDPMSNYYYETYNPATASVKNVSNEAATVNIYPNPAQGTINLALTWNEAQPFTVSVFDMNGALVSSWKVGATAQYNTSIATDTFTSGLYVVSITGANGTISRQVVVAH